MSKSQPKTEVVAKPKQIKLKQKRRVESGGGAKLRLRLPRSHQSWTHPSIMPWWKGSKEKKDEKIQKEKLAWAEAQELVRIMRAKNEREKKKAAEIFSCFKRGRVYDNARADGSCTRLQSVFIQTWTNYSSQMSCGRPFFPSQTDRVPFDFARTAHENTAVSAYVWASVYVCVKRPRLWSGSHQ